MKPDPKLLNGRVYLYSRHLDTMKIEKEMHFLNKVIKNNKNDSITMVYT